MTLTLPFPPSTNTAYANVRGRRVKTKKAREYARAVQDACFEQIAFPPEGKPLEPWRIDGVRLSVALEAFPPDRRRRDIANLEKLAVDAVFAFLRLDDSLIDDLHLIRRDVLKPDGKLVMTITEANGR